MVDWADTLRKTRVEVKEFPLRAWAQRATLLSYGTGTESAIA